MPLPSLRGQEIPAEGLTLDCHVQAEELDLESAGVRAGGEFTLKGDVLPPGEELTVRGVLSGRILRQCVRCLTEYEDACEFPFAVQYVVPTAVSGAGKARQRSPQPKRNEEGETLVEGDVYPIAGDRLDLAPMLREQVILGSPMQAVCRADCRGLCPVCGQDRNLSMCQCSEGALANPFAILKEHRAKSEN